MAKSIKCPVCKAELPKERGKVPVHGTYQGVCKGSEKIPLGKKVKHGST